MEITSSAFADGGRIPKSYVMQAIGGSNISLPLAWRDPPAGTRSYALSVVDPHPVAGNWVHWLVLNIPGDATFLPEGASEHGMPEGSTELRNSYGSQGYGGPQPPAGTGDHPYICTLYALDAEKVEVSSPSLSAFKAALEGKILAEAFITGKYSQ
jgi:Raf kinase inhibitor-like YbhB/YbcL family protein